MYAYTVEEQIRQEVTEAERLVGTNLKHGINVYG